MTTPPYDIEGRMLPGASLDERLLHIQRAAHEISGILVDRGILPTIEFGAYKRPGLWRGVNTKILDGWTIGLREEARAYSGSRDPIKIDLLGTDGNAYIDARVGAPDAIKLHEQFGWDPENPGAFDLLQRLEFVLNTNSRDLILSGRRPDVLERGTPGKDFGLSNRIERVRLGLGVLIDLHDNLHDIRDGRDEWRLGR